LDFPSRQIEPKIPLQARPGENPARMAVPPALLHGLARYCMNGTALKFSPGAGKS